MPVTLPGNASPGGEDCRMNEPRGKGDSVLKLPLFYRAGTSVTTKNRQFLTANGTSAQPFLMHRGIIILTKCS
jgi:hypothetical protein